MSNLSFKAFAQAKGFSPPIGALKVASAMHVNGPPPTISLRGLMATLAPFVPSNLSFNTDGSGATWFYWWDPAALPPWYNGTPDPQRAATSFEFKLWRNNALVTDVTLPLANVLLTNEGMAYSAGVLNGSYTYQIIAFDAFGSASTPVQGAQFSPTTGPTITVTTVGKNAWQVAGTGFNAWNGQQVLVSAAAGATYQSETSQQVMVTNLGNFDIGSFNVGNLCQQTGGGQLKFFVSLPNSPTNVISNTVTGLSCS